MRSSTKCLAWCLALALVACAGLADAKATDVKPGGKKDAPPGRVKDAPAAPAVPPVPAPAAPTPDQPAPDPAPTAPAPTPAPDPADQATPTQPPAVETPTPPASAGPAVAPAPSPSTATTTTGAPSGSEPPAPSTSPSSDAPAPPAAGASAASPPADPSAAPSGAQAPVLATPPAAADAAQDERVPLPGVLGPARGGQAGVSGAVPVPSGDGGVSLWWGVPLAGLVLLGVVLSSGRLVQPRPLPPRARGSPAPAPPATAAVAAVAVAPAGDLDALLRAAKAAAEAERLEEAVLWLDRALRLAPTLPVAHFCRGVCLAGVGRDREAYLALRRAFDLDPSEGAHRLELARACGRLGRASEAMDVLGPLLQAMPALVDDLCADPSFACLLDHPRFLAMTGRLA